MDKIVSKSIFTGWNNCLGRWLPISPYLSLYPNRSTTTPGEQPREALSFRWEYHEGYSYNMSKTSPTSWKCGFTVRVVFLGHFSEHAFLRAGTKSKRQWTLPSALVHAALCEKDAQACHYNQRASLIPEKDEVQLTVLLELRNFMLRGVVAGAIGAGPRCLSGKTKNLQALSRYLVGFLPPVSIWKGRKLHFTRKFFYRGQLISPQLNYNRLSPGIESRFYRRRQIW